VGRIQRYAEGFLSLVGNKVGGREPTQLSDVVIPTVDMTELLRGRLLASEGGISLTSAITDQVVITVPENEVWVMCQASFEYTKSGAADRLRAIAYLTKLPGSNDPLNTLPLLISEAPYNSLVATARIIGAEHFAAPFVLTAGAQCVFEIADTNNAALPWSGKIGVYKFDA
jgi:hypothetical protein